MEDKQQNNPAEIDLFYFFKPLGTLFINAGRGVKYVFKKIQTNIILFSLIVLLISAGGYSLRYFIAPAYQTEGMFVSSILPGKYCSLLLQNLNKLKGTKNLPLLAKQLKIPVEASGDIQSITMLPLRDTFTLERRDTALSLFSISLILKKMDNLDTIQRGLVNYLENNEYAIKRKDAKRKALESLKVVLNRKLESLDSLKEIVNSSIKPRSEGRGIILGEPIDPVSVYQAEMAYYKEQLVTDQALAIIDNIEVIQPFLRINQYNYPRYNSLLFYFFLSSLLLAGFFVMIFGKKPH